MSEMDISEREDYIASARARAETQTEEARCLAMGSNLLGVLARRASLGEDDPILDARTLMDLTDADSREDAVLRLDGIVGSIKTASKERLEQARAANESADWLENDTAT